MQVLDTLNNLPEACRFDVVVVDAGAVQWLQAAFDAG